MIITLRPGEKFEIPVDSYVPIRFGTPYTNAELLAGELSVTWTKGDATGSWEAEASGTSILLEIESGMVTAGFYALKPRAVIAGKPRKFKKAVGMRVLEDKEVL